MAKVQTSKRVNAVTLKIDLIYKLDGTTIVDTSIKYKTSRNDAFKLLEDYLNHQKNCNGDA